MHALVRLLHALAKSQNFKMFIFRKSKTLKLQNKIFSILEAATNHRKPELNEVHACTDFFFKVQIGKKIKHLN